MLRCLAASLTSNHYVSAAPLPQILKHLPNCDNKRMSSGIAKCPKGAKITQAENPWSRWETDMSITIEMNDQVTEHSLRKGITNILECVMRIRHIVSAQEKSVR